MRIGVPITVTEIPPATTNTFNTATAFMVGLGDQGVQNSAVRCLQITDVANAIGQRTATNRTLYDAADTYFREGGSVLYVSRLVGPTPVNATRTLQDAVPHPTVVVTAKTPGVAGNTLFVVVTITGPNYTVLIQDSGGNVLETHGPYATASGNAPLLADTTSTLVNFTQSAGAGFTTAGPAALSATALAGGTDDRGNLTLANLTSALGAFAPTLGPGQVSAPGYTNTTLNGVWSALGSHAQVNNRVAICDMDDAATAATLVSNIGTFGTSGVASYCGFWGGSVVVPAATGTGANRTVAPSAVISALCARADGKGNPNLAAAGDDFPLLYVTGFTGTAGAPLYLQADIDTLNASGINTWNTVFGAPQNYGFVSPVLQTADSIFWQFNHARLRMALVARFQVLGQPFVFSQIDGKGLDAAAFSGVLAADLQTFVKSGAIYTQAPNGSQDQGFTVDVGPSVNTPTTIAAGQLGANVNVRMSPFAQLIPINLNSVPVTQQI